MASPKVMELVELFETEAVRDRPPAETPAVGSVTDSDSAIGIRVGANAEEHGPGTLAVCKGAK